MCQKIYSSVVDTCIVKWYKSIYSGSIILCISIVNLISIPYLNYYEAIHDFKGVDIMILIQFSLNIIYLLDILVMFFVFGIRDFFLKRSWALRLELLFQILHFCKIKDYYNLWFQDNIENEAAFIGFI